MEKHDQNQGLPTKAKSLQRLKKAIATAGALALTAPAFAVVDPTAATTAISSNTVVDVLAGAMIVVLAGIWISKKGMGFMGR